MCIVWLLSGCGGGETAQPGSEGAPDAGGSPARRLTKDGPEELRLAPGERVELRAVLFEGERPVAGVPIHFSIEGPAAGAALGAAQSETDGWGRAATTLSAGAEARFEVRAHADGATSSWAVTVARPTHGDLLVAVPYTGASALLAVLGSGRVRAHPESVRCADLTPRGASPAAMAEAILEGPGAEALVGRLPAGRYTIAASLERRDRPVVLAWGCAGGVEVAGGERRRVEVPATEVPLVVVGPYSVVAQYDLSHAIPGAVGEFARTLLAAFDDRDEYGYPVEDPGYFLAELLLRQLFDEVPPLGVAVLARILNDQVIARVPWLSAAAEIGGALAEVLTRLEVRSELIIEKRGGEPTARERWESLVVRYRGQPHTLSLRDGRIAPSGGGSGVGADMTFTTPEGELRFAPHPLRFAYGRLALLLLEQVVLPAVAGVTSLRAALGALVDCAALAAAVAGTVLPIAAGVCEAALDAADLLLRAALEGLDASPAALSREGSGRPVDDDFDEQAVADRIEAGRWRGRLAVGREVLPFTATWSAIRRGH
jgi:hypothetical protein